MKLLKRLSLVTLLALVVYLYFPHSTIAQASVSSPNYVIQMPNFNSGAGIPSSSGYKVDTTIGQTAAGLFSSSGYLVRSGFQYIHSIIPFSFSISDFIIDFGQLIAETPANANSTLVVSAGGAGGYEVLARESDYLSSTGDNIPDTTCDASDCSQSAASVWTLSTTYGFGYNMSGDDVPGDFTDSTYFRHFANASLLQSDEVVMSNVNVGRSRTATITYKVNVSPTQSGGQYQTTVLFTAVPSY